MKLIFGRLVGVMLVSLPSLAFAGSQPPIGINWSPVSSVPTLGAFGAYLLIALVAITALKVFRQKPGLLRGFVLLSASALIASGTLYIDQVVSGPTVITASTCERGSDTYGFQDSSAQFANDSECPMLLNLDITDQPSFCAWQTPDLVNGGVVQPGQSGALPYWSCL
jgi:hypothetical protein